MKDRGTRSGIVAVVVATAAGLGVAAVLLVQMTAADRPDIVQSTPEPQPVVDIASVYDPVVAGEALPDGFRQLLARDQIAPVYDPQYTTRDRVDWPGDMLVIGVEGTETEKAYPITHLNQHEMVIDDLDGLPMLVSW